MVRDAESKYKMKPIKVTAEKHFKLVFFLQEYQESVDIKILATHGKEELELLIKELNKILESF
jgi:hypothetical protein